MRDLALYNKIRKLSFLEIEKIIKSSKNKLELEYIYKIISKGQRSAIINIHFNEMLLNNDHLPAYIITKIFFVTASFNERINKLIINHSNTTKYCLLSLLNFCVNPRFSTTDDYCKSQYFQLLLNNKKIEKETFKYRLINLLE